MKHFLCFIFLIVLADARRRTMDNIGPKKEREIVEDDPLTFYYTQQNLDHFDAQNNRTWTQRFFVNASFWDGTGPIFLCVGGEGPPLESDVVVTGDVHCADMVNLAPNVSALMVAVEHRYYGESIPTEDFSTPNLKWLSSRQALADLAQIHGYINEMWGATDTTRWVSWGGSYPGMLSAWFRLKYPHLVFAAVSSSAPVRAEANMEGYNDVVGQSIAAPIVGGSQKCLDVVTAAFTQVGLQLGNEAGRRSLEMQFNVCVKFALDNVNNQMEFTEELSYLFPAQSNDPACTTLGCNISSVCNAIMLNESYGVDPVSRLAALNYIMHDGECLPINYDLYLVALKDPTIRGGVERIWFYQTCTEFGFYQTCDPTSTCPFTSNPWLSTLQSNFVECQWAFDLTPNEIQYRINMSNAVYGSDHTAGYRIFFVNGQIDPWHANSVLQPLSPYEPALWVQGSSHHYWTHPPEPTDSIYIVQARETIWAQVISWLAEPY